jgi:hypothetical protein
MAGFHNYRMNCEPSIIYITFIHVYPFLPPQLQKGGYLTKGYEYIKFKACLLNRLDYLTARYLTCNNILDL